MTHIFVFLGVCWCGVSWRRVLWGLVGGCGVFRCFVFRCLVFRCGVSGLVVSIAGSGDGEESGDKEELKLRMKLVRATV